MTELYQVRDTHNTLIGTYSTKARARNKADKLDNAYGGYCHKVWTVTE